VKTVTIMSCNGFDKVHPEMYLELVASLQDQPECRASNCLMLGSGRYSARWGYSADISSLLAKISSCNSCDSLNLMDDIMTN
jgi:hypothetical protein